jgi:transcriptional regulator with XRE-family HTH domain
MTMSSTSRAVDFAAYLRRWLADHDVSQAEFGRRVGIRQTLVNRYVHVDPATRVRPGPDALRKMAPTLGVPHAELLRMAGYLAPNPESEEEEIDLHEREVRDKGALLAELLRDLPEDQWLLAFDAMRGVATAFQDAARRQANNA